MDLLSEETGESQRYYLHKDFKSWYLVNGVDSQQPILYSIWTIDLRWYKRRWVQTTSPYGHLESNQKTCLHGNEIDRLRNDALTLANQSPKYTYRLHSLGQPITSPGFQAGDFKQFVSVGKGDVGETP